MSKIEVDQIDPQSGTELTIGSSGDTIKTGGNLDTNDKNIVTASNRDLNLYPNGTGAVEIGGNTNPGTIILNCESNSHGIKLQSPAHSAGQSYTIKFPTGNITAGKFLKVDSVSGSGTTGIGQLSFYDAGGGAYIHLQTQTVSSGVAQVDFTSNLATYDTIKFVFSGVHPATDNVTFLALVSTDGGSSYLSTTYNAAGAYLFSGSSNGDQGNASDKIILNGACGNATNESQSGFLEMNNLASTTYYKNTQSLVTGVHDTGALIATHGGCSIHQTSAINGVRFKFSSGNIDAGTFSLYGVKRS